MGIALFTLSSLLTPLQGMVSRMMTLNRRRAARTLPWSSRSVMHVRTTVARPGCGPEFPACEGGPASRKDIGVRPRRSMPLRVVRTIESGIPAGSTGRMKISGRMADVCAELERLAALEAAT